MNLYRQAGSVSHGHIPRSPAHQLKSVSYRYTLQWPGRGAPGSRPLGSRWGVGETGEPEAIAGAGHVEELPQDRLSRLEAVLFLAREPLSSRKLSHHANLADGTEARTLIGQLNRQYEQKGSAFRVEEFAGGFQLLTRPRFATWLRRLEHVPREVRLSTPALETLAVVAYRQPALRADIESVRGVNCGEILRQLLEQDLIRIGGRSEELGRPYMYVTSKRFLRLFGLRSLDDLPCAAEWRTTPQTAIVEENGPHASQRRESKVSVIRESCVEEEIL